jgi:hypothetical protein
MVNPKLQLPIVITTHHGDPAELAERIIRQNPDLFGTLPENTYRTEEGAGTLEELLATAERQRDEYKKYWRDRALDAEKRLTILTWAGTACLAVIGLLLVILCSGQGWF